MKIYNNRVEIGNTCKNWINSSQHNKISHAPEESTTAFLWCIGIFIIVGVIIFAL